MLKNLGILAALCALAPYLADFSFVLGWTPLPFVGLLIYRLTMAMHDCGHASLFVEPHVNRRVGKLLGYLTGVDFERFRERHWEHHKRLGVAGDPQGFHYLGTSSMTRGAFAWHTLKPLLGCNLKHVLRESHLHRDSLARCFASGELVAIAVVQLVVAVLITGAGRHLWLALMPGLGAATFACSSASSGGSRSTVCEERIATRKLSSGAIEAIG